MKDTGARCERHVGEVFPPRCNACTELDGEYRELNITAEGH